MDRAVAVACLGGDERGVGVGEAVVARIERANGEDVAGNGGRQEREEIALLRRGLACVWRGDVRRESHHVCCT